MAALAIGYYIYSVQIRGVTDGKPPAQQVNLIAVRNDLLTLGQAERLYLATNGTYGTLDELRQSGNMSSLPEDNNRGYTYVAEVRGAAHFRITAKPADLSRTDLPIFSIDETMRIQFRGQATQLPNSTSAN
jgi:hypothetical protein